LEVAGVAGMTRGEHGQFGLGALSFGFGFGVFPSVFAAAANAAASSLDIAPSATATMLNLFRACCAIGWPTRSRSRRREFPESNHVRTTGDPGAQSQPTRAMPHDFRDDYTMVTVRGAVQAIDGFGRNSQGRVETNGRNRSWPRRYQ